MSRSVESRPVYIHPDSNFGAEQRLDSASYRSRYTVEYAEPVEDETKTEQALGILAELSPAQRRAAELHGMASMSFAEAARFAEVSIGSISMAWCHVVEKATGETPERLENRRAWERQRNKVKAPRKADTSPVHGTNSTYVNYCCQCKPCLAAHAEHQRGWRLRQRMKALRKARYNEIQQQYRRRLYEKEQQTGITPDALVNDRKNAKAQRERFKEMRRVEAETGYTDPRLTTYREQQRVRQAKRRKKLQQSG